MKIALAAAESVPFVKTGGLADVVGALAKNLKSMGHEVVVFLPRYKKVDAQAFGLKTVCAGLRIFMGGEAAKADLKMSSAWESVPFYFVDYPPYFGREELYRTEHGDYEDNGARFIFFSKAVLEGLKAIDFLPDVVHAHDWQAAMVNVILKTSHRDDPFLARAATVFTVHNLAYQGLFPQQVMELTGIPREEFNPEGLEYYGQLNILKGGIVYSDIISTVSQTYAREILSAEFGRGLDGVLRNRERDLYGIVNGIDYEQWDPVTDKYLGIRYEPGTVKRKEQGKKLFLERNKLSCSSRVPLLGMVSRLDPQKGLDILGEAMEELMGLELQFVLLGKGDDRYQTMFAGIGKKYPRRALVKIGFDDKLAHHIYACSDIFLMPSAFEPCGLGQLIAMKYGAVPVVRQTGGLADTVTEYDPATGAGNGFCFKDHDAKSLVAAVKRALTHYENKKNWRKLVANNMKTDFSWNKQTPLYISLYKKALKKKRTE